jgi:hypothetical protein
MSIGAGFSVFVVFGLSTIYSLSVIASLQAPSSELARLMAPWDQRLHAALRPLFDAFGGAPCPSQSPRALRLYRAYVELIVVNLVIAASCFLATSPFWADWGRRLRNLPRWASTKPEQIESELEIGQATTLTGALGTVWFLVAVAPYPTQSCSALDAWLFMRAPLAITLAYGLACLTAAFGSARARADSY